ncbi:hypothetical protein H8D51_00690 [bacterium]|nr:hypothetical protein [bacterium]
MSTRSRWLSLLILLILIANQAYAIDVIVKLKNDRTIEGILLSITPERIQLDPEGAVSLLTLNSEDIITLTYCDTGEILFFPIADAQIPPEIRKTAKRSFERGKPTYHRNLLEMYFFGGFSSETTIDEVVVYDYGDPYYFPLIYKNGGLGGFGTSIFYDSKKRGFDYLLDIEMSFISAEMKTDMFGTEVGLLDGSVLAIDVDLSFYPFPVRVLKYPTPFLFVGVGLRSVSMSDDYGNEASESHGAFIFGAGARWQISDSFALQLRERCIRTSLEGVETFTQYETRLEMYFTFERW